MKDPNCSDTTKESSLLVSPPRIQKEPFEDKTNDLLRLVASPDKKQDNWKTPQPSKKKKPFSGDYTWKKKIEQAKDKLQSTNPSSEKKEKLSLLQKKNKQKQHQALGDILTERILDMDSTLLTTVPIEEWEGLLAMPMEIMQDILWNIEYHEERGMIFEWKGIQRMILAHQMGLPSLSHLLLE